MCHTIWSVLYGSIAWKAVSNDCYNYLFFSSLPSLPGRVLANGEAIWLCDASYADTKVFFRSLLAKVGDGQILYFNITELGI